MDAGSGRISLLFELTVNNSLRGFTLYLIEFDGATGSGTNRRTEFHFDFGPSGEHGWREGTRHGAGKFFATPRFVDDVAKKAIEAIRDKRTNRRRPPIVTVW
jgi:hypothetical protein